MKKFSKKWKSSKKPSKQRKYKHNSPLHTKSKIVSSRLSKELSKKYGIRNISARKGDRVKIMRGQFKGKIGKINRVNLKTTKIYVDGVDQSKIEGGRAPYPIHPSNVIITEVYVEDRRRFKQLKEKKEK
ncbi:50S ribosomal protein L24 [Candidatus Woesearchaeota archaeon]|nr:50S ribosomal protein L24 [Candidatus Woesearchaeota archaeon]